MQSKSIMLAAIFLMALLLSFGCAQQKSTGAQSSSYTGTQPYHISGHIDLQNVSNYANQTDTIYGVSGNISTITLNNLKSGWDATMQVIDDGNNVISTNYLAGGAAIVYNRSTSGNLFYGNLSVRVIPNFTNSSYFPLGWLVSWFRLDEGAGNISGDNQSANTLEILASNATSTSVGANFTNASAWLANGFLSSMPAVQLNGINETLRINQSAYLNTTLKNASYGNWTFDFWAMIPSAPTLGPWYLFHAGLLGNITTNDTNLVSLGTASCANSTTSTNGTGVCPLNVVPTNNNASNYIVTEENASNGTAYNWSENISNSTLLNNRTTFDVDVYGFYIPDPLNNTGPVWLDVFNGTAQQRLVQLPTTPGWTNITSLNPWIYAPGNITYITLEHNASGANYSGFYTNTTKAGIYVAYVGLNIHYNYTLNNGTALEVFNSTTLRWIMSQNTSQWDLFCPTTSVIGDGLWHNYAMVYGSNGSSLYLDNALYCNATITSSLNLNTSTDPIWMGDGYQTANNSLLYWSPIAYDNMFWFNHTLYAANISYLYNQSKGVHATYDILARPLGQ